MPVALPFVQAGFGIARADASLPYTLAMTGFALGGVAMGRLYDRLGVMVAIMLGTLALGIGYVGAALAPGLLTFALMPSCRMRQKRGLPKMEKLVCRSGGQNRDWDRE